MAAAQAARLGLPDLVESLCAFAWCRLGQCGGREIAELATAAAKLGCHDERFFCFVAKHCSESPGSFACLRDLALVATAFLRCRPALQGAPRGATLQVEVASAFEGLATAAIPQFCGGRVNIRDAAEFLYAFGLTLGTAAVAPSFDDPGVGVNAAGPGSGAEHGPLYCRPIAVQAVVAGVAAVRPQLHHASGQDIAKLAGCVGAAWPLLPHLHWSTLQPFASDLAQAVRFRCTDLNAQDISLTAIAFSKMSLLEEMAADVLAEEVVRRLPEFFDKDLSLFLLACSRPGWAAERCGLAAIAQVQERDLSRFSVQDLCMIAQALAKIGPKAKAHLCVVADEVFGRQTSGFTTADKAVVLWALAKAKVAHLGLTRLLVRSLAVEDCQALARDVVSAALWALAVTWPSLADAGDWPRHLAQRLCKARPWSSAPPFEIANAVWACGQLPYEHCSASWASLLAAATSLDMSSLSLHELCNLLSGAVAVGARAGAEAPAAARLAAASAAELTRRCHEFQCSGGEALSAHDRRLLDITMEKVQGQGHAGAWPPAELRHLAELMGFAACVGSACGGDAAEPCGRQRRRRAPRSSRGPARQASPKAAEEEDEEDEEATPAEEESEGARGDEDEGDDGGDETSPLASPACAPVAPSPAAVSACCHDGGDAEGAAPEEGPKQSQPGCSLPGPGAHGAEGDADAVVGPTGRRHGKLTCNMTCCPKLYGRDRNTSESLLRLNAHCSYSGHCVQLKRTFIHVECTSMLGDSSDDDCVLCQLSRPRAKSSDNLELFREVSPTRCSPRADALSSMGRLRSLRLTAPPSVAAHAGAAERLEEEEERSPAVCSREGAPQNSAHWQ